MLHLMYKQHIYLEVNILDVEYFHLMENGDRNFKIQMIALLGSI